MKKGSLLAAVLAASIAAAMLVAGQGSIPTANRAPLRQEAARLRLLVGAAADPGHLAEPGTRKRWRENST